MNDFKDPNMSFQMLPVGQQLQHQMHRGPAGLSGIRDQDLHVRNLVDGGFRSVNEPFRDLSVAVVEEPTPLLVRESVVMENPLLAAMLVEPEPALSLADITSMSSRPIKSLGFAEESEVPLQSLPRTPSNLREFNEMMERFRDLDR